MKEHTPRLFIGEGLEGLAAWLAGPISWDPLEGVRANGHQEEAQIEEKKQITPLTRATTIQTGGEHITQRRISTTTGPQLLKRTGKGNTH